MKRKIKSFLLHLLPFVIIISLTIGVYFIYRYNEQYNLFLTYTNEIMNLAYVNNRELPKTDKEIEVFEDSNEKYILNNLYKIYIRYEDYIKFPTKPKTNESNFEKVNRIKSIIFNEKSATVYIEVKYYHYNDIGEVVNFYQTNYLIFFAIANGGSGNWQVFGVKTYVYF